ncbi:MAG: RHS repeat-associated core domain-containing protein, partial [Candidatus Omnitrophica bacterium]|nr:RHS repeat-associated core domain-containing protein [Candidatus Omnitrophota bacterium]
NVVPAEAGIQYQYDGTGKRIYALEAGIETHYYYDGLVPVIERDAAGVLSAQTVRGIGYGGGIGSVISRTASFINDKGKLKYKKLYYHYDGVGNVVKLSNKNAGGAGAYAYDAFGNDLSTENNNTENNPYEFATKETSAVTGLVYFGARYYDPSIGRWITKDPMGMIDGPNLYAYVGNSPVNFVDPWGLCKEDTDDKSLLEKIQDLLHDNRIDLATAREIARRLLKEFNTHNDIGDALRHAEWSRQMAAEINQLTAYVVGVGHEIENMIQGQPINEMRMDLHNNAEGRRAAQENRSIDVDNLVSNPGGNDSWPY